MLKKIRKWRNWYYLMASACTSAGILLTWEHRAVPATVAFLYATIAICIENWYA